MSQATTLFVSDFHYLGLQNNNNPFQGNEHGRCLDRQNTNNVKAGVWSFSLCLVKAKGFADDVMSWRMVNRTRQQILRRCQVFARPPTLRLDPAVFTQTSYEPILMLYSYGVCVCVCVCVR